MARLRLGVAVAMLIVGLPLVVILAGGQVFMCLGPLNVTAVECARTTGHLPAVGPGPVAVGALVLGALVLLTFDSLRRSVLPSIGGAIGAVGGAAVYVAFRPRAMEGFTSTGEWLSLPLPLDPGGLAAAAVLGAALGLGLVVLAERSVSTRHGLDRTHQRG